MHYLYLNIHIATLIHAHSFFTRETQQCSSTVAPLWSACRCHAPEKKLLCRIYLPGRPHHGHAHVVYVRASVNIMMTCLNDYVYKYNIKKRYQLSLTWSSKYWLRKPGCGKPIAAITNILWNPVIKYSTARSARALQQIQPWFSLLCMPPFRIASNTQTWNLSWQ